MNTLVQKAVTLGSLWTFSKKTATSKWHSCSQKVSVHMLFNCILVIAMLIPWNQNYLNHAFYLIAAGINPDVYKPREKNYSLNVIQCKSYFCHSLCFFFLFCKKAQGLYCQFIWFPFHAYKNIITQLYIPTLSEQFRLTRVAWSIPAGYHRALLHNYIIIVHYIINGWIYNWVSVFISNFSQQCTTHFWNLNLKSYNYNILFV